MINWNNNLGQFYPLGTVQNWTKLRTLQKGSSNALVMFSITLMGDFKHNKPKQHRHANLFCKQKIVIKKDKYTQPQKVPKKDVSQNMISSKSFAK